MMGLMKMYKGFNKDLTCREFQYVEGKTYEAEGEVCAFKNGFHACELAADTFAYYPPGTSTYHAVELEDFKTRMRKLGIAVSLKVTAIVLSLPVIVVLYTQKKAHG
jgi:hypothetical protein